MSRLHATVLIAVSALVGGCGIVPTGARVTRPTITSVANAVSAGCGHMDAEGQRGLGLNEDFKELGGRGGTGMEFIPDAGLDAVRKDGFDISIPELPGDLKLVRVFHPVPWEADFFFWTHEIGPDVTNWDLIASGGIVVGLLTHRGADAAIQVKKVLGDQVTMVAVGDYQAAINHGDSLDGFRPYAITWSDSRFDWRINAGFKDAASVINLARSFAC